uniref:RNA-directed DNA polymerase, eukaryota, reverse transcriptase zinc-binding domain protein n=1 Tax=Tanacetum cinerariifolium TaxID=118510 RepID=A0A6L2N102_TANCI|nr:RNA-directed DNA polymerase, eukaryota, reverse transcriptase zinc-binding domain protein [Tanacetum cinerariifolium]
MDDMFRNTLSNKEALFMVRDIQDKEIKDALFDIDSDKAYGPDGYSFKFFKKAWVVVGDEFLLAVKEFFKSGQLLGEINATIIALIPKIRDRVKEHFYYEIGKGDNVSVWYDKWNSYRPIGNFISQRKIYEARLPIDIKVADMIHNQRWVWPNEWTIEFSELVNILVPDIDNDKDDKVVWVTNAGKKVNFSTKKTERMEDIIPGMTEALVPSGRTSGNKSSMNGCRLANWIEIARTVTSMEDMDLFGLPLLFDELDAKRTVGDDELHAKSVEEPESSLTDDSFRSNMDLFGLPLLFDELDAKRTVGDDELHAKSVEEPESSLTDDSFRSNMGIILSVVEGGGGGGVSSTAMDAEWR